MASIWKTKTSKTAGPLNQIKSTPKATVKKKVTPVTPVSSSGIADINFDAYKSQSASINDISKKYGIDYSREYAARQAEAEAQAKRSGLQGQQKQIDEGVRNAQDALSRDYFQKGLTQAQANVNGGINAGLANESNLRLSMNRQGEMGDIMGQANLARNEVGRQLTDVEVARKAQEEAIYNERLQEAIGVIQQDRSLDQEQKLAMMNAMLTQRGQNIDQTQFTQQMDWDKYQFNNMSATDKTRLDWDKYIFNNMSAEQKAMLDWDKYMFNNMSATDKSQLDWSKYQFNNMSAADQAQNKLAYAQLEQEKAQFATEQAWREYSYKNMSASEKAQLDEDKRQFGEEMAWRNYELEYTAEMSLAEAGAGLDFLP